VGTFLNPDRQADTFPDRSADASPDPKRSVDSNRSADSGRLTLADAQASSCPALIPDMNAAQSAVLKTSFGPSGFLLSRNAILLGATGATSRQFPFCWE